MKRDNKKALYESIMTSVAKEVKKVLNESTDYSIAQNFYNKAEEYSQASDGKYFIGVHWTDENGNIYSEILKRFYETVQSDKNLLLNLTNDCFDGDIIYGDNFKRSNISYIELVKFSVGKSKLINKTIFRINLSEKGNQYLNKIMEKKYNRYQEKYKSPDKLAYKNELNGNGTLADQRTTELLKFLDTKYNLNYGGIQRIKYTCDLLSNDLIKYAKDIQESKENKTSIYNDILGFVLKTLDKYSEN